MMTEAQNGALRWSKSWSPIFLAACLAAGGLISAQSHAANAAAAAASLPYPVRVVPGGESVLLLGARGTGLVGLGAVSYFVPEKAGVSAFGHPVTPHHHGHGGAVPLASRPGPRQGTEPFYLVLAHTVGFHRVATHARQPGHGQGIRAVSRLLTHPFAWPGPTVKENTNLPLREKEARGKGQVVARRVASTDYGLVGQGWSAPRQAACYVTVPIARATEVRGGPAVLLSNVEGDGVESFHVEIVALRGQTAPGDEGIAFRVHDRRLLRRAGGVALGLSGSPILQDGRLVGMVSMVDDGDPRLGYAHFAQWDYEAKFGTPGGRDGLMAALGGPSLP